MTISGTRDRSRRRLRLPTTLRGSRGRSVHYASGMRSESCACGGTLFFGDRSCLRCERRVVLCPSCRQTAAVQTRDDGTLRCLNPECPPEGDHHDDDEARPGAILLHCGNSFRHRVCNGAVIKVEAGQPGFNLCRYCRLNQVIPALTVAGNLEKWRRLEQAKHRVLAGFEQVGFGLEAAAVSASDALRFEFKSADVEPVNTGHWHGVITIRLSEADSVVREQQRVLFGESKRTLTDHFRHELGHYVWDWLVGPNRLGEFRDLFGNEAAVPYEQARGRHYAGGGPADWRKRHVTEYASMHPWEDFAETFRVYLELDAALRTAAFFGFLTPTGDAFGARIIDFLRLGVAGNELARDFGFDDIVAESFPDPVIAKLRFISELPSLVAETSERLQPAPAGM